MKRKLLKSTVLSAMLLASSAFAIDVTLKQGWNLIGSSDGFGNASVIFNKTNIKTVWTFDKDNKTWSAYSPDSNIMQQIIDNQSINTLSTISPYSGFWVYVTNDDTISLPGGAYGNGDNNDDNNNYDQNYTFANPLQNVTLDMFAGKSFKIVDKEYQDVNYKTITFDSNGVASFTEEHNYCYEGNEQNSTTETVTVKVESNQLNSYIDGNLKDSYKILAYDANIGVVLGRLNVGSNNYDNEPVIFAINADATENPQIMSNKIPYKEYNIWSWDNSYTSYESNGSVVEHYGSHENEDGNYTIENGAIKAIREDSLSNGAWRDEYSLQTIYSIGNFDINKGEYNGYYYVTVVSYEDSNEDGNGSWSDINLTANPDIDTWQEFFNETNWTLYDTKYYDNNHTTSRGATFSISSDGKILSVQRCGYEDNLTITSGKIEDTYQDTWIGIVSTTPIYTSTNNGSPRVLSNKKDIARKLPIYLPKRVKDRILNHR